MDGIERAIRNALEKGDAGQAAFRQRVYQQAFAALDRALKQNPELTVEAAIKRRRALQAKVDEIEASYVDPVRAQDAPSGTSAPELGGVTKASPEPLQQAGPAPHVDPVGQAEPDGSGLGPAQADPAPRSDSAEYVTDAAPALGGETRTVTPRRRGLAMLFVAVTLLAAAVIGLWWSWDSGFFKTASERDTSVPNPPPALEDEEFSPPASVPPLADRTAGERDWITIFDPADAAGVTAAQGASAQLGEAEGESVMRIVSATADDAVSFDVGRGVLEQIAGRKAVFVIEARADEGETTQMSVECSLGGLGDCGRMRYAVGYERGEFLFEVELAQGAPGSSGTISLTSDFEGGGKAVDIYAIRVAVTE